eukprot:11864846-Karenia_brevis.AAC.1
MTHHEGGTRSQDQAMLQRPMSSSATSPKPTTNQNVFGTFASSQAYKAGAAQTTGRSILPTTAF